MPVQEKSGGERMTVRGAWIVETGESVFGMVASYRAVEQPRSIGRVARPSRRAAGSRQRQEAAPSAFPKQNESSRRIQLITQFSDRSPLPRTQKKRTEH